MFGAVVVGDETVMLFRSHLRSGISVIGIARSSDGLTGWRVEAETTAFAGGVDARVPEPTDPMAPTLSVRAMTIFGGVSVMAHGPRELEAEQPV